MIKTLFSKSEEAMKKTIDKYSMSSVLSEQGEQAVL